MRKAIEELVCQRKRLLSIYFSLVVIIFHVATRFIASCSKPTSIVRTVHLFAWIIVDGQTTARSCLQLVKLGVDYSRHSFCSFFRRVHKKQKKKTAVGVRGSLAS